MKLRYDYAIKFLRNSGMDITFSDKQFKPLLRSMGISPVSVGSKSVSAHIPKDVDQAMMDLCSANNISKADIIRDALREYLGVKGEQV
jgi:hypothetical protein